MAICRFSPSCDVFVDYSDDGRIECVACRLDERATFRALDQKAMIEHLREHVSVGHKVPDTVFEELNIHPVH